MAKFATLFRLSGREWRFFIQALWLLPFYQSLVRFLPFSSLISFCGLREGGKGDGHVSEHHTGVAQISWAIRAVEQNLPFWPGKCLAQALTARFLLYRMKLPCTILLAVRCQEERELFAHAWARCGKTIVTGGPRDEQFAELVTFL